MIPKEILDLEAILAEMASKEVSSTFRSTDRHCGEIGEYVAACLNAAPKLIQTIKLYAGALGKMTDPKSHISECVDAARQAQADVETLWGETNE